MEFGLSFLHSIGTLLFSKHICSYITFKSKQIFRMCNFTSFLHYGSMIGLYILNVILFKYTFFFK